MTRRALLSLLGVGAPGAAYAGYVEPRWLEVTRVGVGLPGLVCVRPIRLLHLSDLHASTIVPLHFLERAVGMAVAERPDVCCVTGDFITAQADFDRSRYVRLLKRLSSAAPTFAVVGNHDGGLWARGFGGYSDHTFVERLLEESGIELLHNRSQEVRIAEAKIRLVGVADYWSDEMDGVRAFREATPGAPTILLSHNPDSKAVLGRYPWHLMLSGHTHGGQVIVPLVGPCFAPVEDKRYVAGLKAWGSRQIHVSRGIGNVGGVRFGCRPEISVLTLTG
jgi:predicted MPP superfamily phosphohydrolase